MYEVVCVYNALDYGACAGKYECDFAMGISGVKYSEIICGAQVQACGMQRACCKNTTGACTGDVCATIPHA